MRTADPRHAAILRGMATVAMFALFGKLVGAGKEMAVAFRYGLAAEVDAYQFLDSLIGWPIGIWSSVLTAVLVPLAVRMREAGGADLARFRAELLGLALWSALALVLLGWAGFGALRAGPGASLPAAVAGQLEQALPPMLALLPLGVLVALQSAWMLSAGRHVNTLYDCIGPACIALAVLAWPGGGIGPLVWGALFGAAAHLLVLLAPAIQAGAASWRRHRPRFGLASPQWPAFWQGFGIMLLGQAFMSFTTVIDQFYAVGMGTGAVATLGYANRLLSLLLTLAAVAVARATLPVFSQGAADDGGRLWSVVSSWVRLMFGAGLVAWLACLALAPLAVGLLFERGQFGADDTARVAQTLSYGLPQLPFYFSSMVLVSYALSQRRYRLVFWSGLIGCGAKLLGNMLLAPSLGVNGIALATACVYALNALFFRLALVRRAGDGNRGRR